jgi:hypothetical protein
VDEEEAPRVVPAETLATLSLIVHLDSLRRDAGALAFLADQQPKRLLATSVSVAASRQVTRSMAWA